jgi:UDP-N-acetylglucosamine diphosphorylase/glucosamine-1-phosphate N-acetyltransferase
MNVLLFDTPQVRDALQPFSAIRPIAMIRWGVYTLLEKWEHHLPATYSFATTPYLAKRFPPYVTEKNLCVKSNICPTPSLVTAMLALKDSQVLVQHEKVLAFWADKSLAKSLYPAACERVLVEKKKVEWEEPLLQLDHVWNLFLANETAIRQDVEYIYSNNTSLTIADPHTICYNPAAIFVEKNVSTRAAILNAEKGPIYIGEDVVIEEQAVIRGPVAICQGAQVKVNACLYGGTTIGPYAKVGGEIYNTLVGSYSNKAHNGFIGNAVIGSWCNLGAYTSNSNLRNDYGLVQVWNMATSTIEKTHLQFCGLFLGDYTKCGIHSMFNTGTVVGLAANLFGTGFFDRFIPSFVKGSPPASLVLESLEALIASIEAMMLRRNQIFSLDDKAILSYLYQMGTCAS